jgi:hypothetical protein
MKEKKRWNPKMKVKEREIEEEKEGSKCVKVQHVREAV